MTRKKIVLGHKGKNVIHKTCCSVNKNISEIRFLCYSHGQCKLLGCSISLLLHFNVSKETCLQCHSWLCSSIGICCTLWSIFHVQKSLEMLHLSWQCLYQLVCCCIVLQAPFDGLAKQPCLMIEDIKTPFSFCVAEWELYWMNQLVYSADSEHWVSITVAFWQT